MKVLVATEISQGLYPHDHCTTVVGSIVVPAAHCTNEKCSCQVAFTSPLDLEDTTTVIVMERDDLTEDDLQFWVKQMYGGQVTPDHVRQLITMIAKTTEGDVLRRQGTRLYRVPQMYA
jgi:hypothetical protein